MNTVKEKRERLSVSNSKERVIVIGQPLQNTSFLCIAHNWTSLPFQFPPLETRNLCLTPIRSSFTLLRSSSPVTFKSILEKDYTSEFVLEAEPRSNQNFVYTGLLLCTPSWDKDCPGSVWGTGNILFPTHSFCTQGSVNHKIRYKGWPTKEK